MAVWNGLSRFRVMGVALAFLCGCTPWLNDGERRTQRTGGVKQTKDPDLALRAICDVERVRARSELLKKFDAEKFRSVALKISKQVTAEDIADLQRLETARRREGDLSPDSQRRRNELVQEIYTGAIARAGLKRGIEEKLEGSSYSYSVDVDLLSVGNDSYVSFISGRLTLELEKAEPGSITHLQLGANPDQSRYSIRLLRLYRIETDASGARIPIHESLSLPDYVEESLPRNCARAGSSLDPEAFSTITGAAPVQRGPASDCEPIELNTGNLIGFMSFPLDEHTVRARILYRDGPTQQIPLRLQRRDARVLQREIGFLLNNSRQAPLRLNRQRARDGSCTPSSLDD